MNNHKRFRYSIFGLLMLAASVAVGAEQRGQVRFGEVPVPGVSVQATQCDKTLHVMTDDEGRYVLPDTGEGTWTVQIEMAGFETLKRDIVITPDTAATQAKLSVGNVNKSGVLGSAFGKRRVQQFALGQSRLNPQDNSST